MDILGKKALVKLGSRINESRAAPGISPFARSIMEKMGWKDGHGLGKNEDGRVEHIKVVKKEENTGIGLEQYEREKVTENWWHGSFAEALNSMKESGINIGVKNSKKKEKEKKEKKKKKGKEKKVKDFHKIKKTENRKLTIEERERLNNPTFEDLFKATGGKRMGMRARAVQKGKWERTEHIDMMKPSISEVYNKIDANECVVNEEMKVESKKDFSSDDSSSKEKRSKISKSRKKDDSIGNSSESNSNCFTTNYENNQKSKKKKKTKKLGD